MRSAAVNNVNYFLDYQKMATLYEKFDFASLVIEPPSRGSRLAPIYSCKSRAVPTFLLSAGPTLFSPFGASAFEEGQTRLSINYHIPDELAQWFDAVDAHFVAQLAAKSEELLKKKMSADEIRAIYKPTVTRKDEFPPTLKLKYNTAGSKAVRCWTQEGASVELDDLKDLRNHPATAIVKPTGFWSLGGKECGVSFDVVSMLLAPSRAICPFAMSED